MPSQTPTLRYQCACGRTEYEARGEPMATVACYCADCRMAGQQIDAMPNGRSGLQADGGIVGSMFRKDRVACVRGRELLVDHKLKPASPTVRIVAGCCNCNIGTRFENWAPMVILRSFAPDAAPTVDICICTKSAPDPTRIVHDVPRHAGLPPWMIMKVLAATVGLQLARLPLENRVY
jgi:hypothetical protein